MIASTYKLSADRARQYLLRTAVVGGGNGDCRLRAALRVARQSVCRAVSPHGCVGAWSS